MSKITLYWPHGGTVTVGHHQKRLRVCHNAGDEKATGPCNYLSEQEVRQDELRTELSELQ
jgi:hypothetical protein